MIKKQPVFFGLVLAILTLAVIFVIPAVANILTSATATADCSGFTLTVDAADLTVNTQYTIDFTFTLTCPGAPTIVKTGIITFTATGAAAAEKATGTWQTSPLPTNCTVIGSAELASSGSTVTIIINGSSSASLSCSLTDERMTGGGSVFVDPTTEVVINGGTDAFRVTHGFEIHCGAPPPKPDTLEVNWPGHHFHLETLTLGACVCDPAFLPPENPDAGFNEFIGTGTGKLDGVAGASIVFVFTDQGEPGTNDTEQMTIFNPSSSPVLSFPKTNLRMGNQQAHREGGAKVPPCVL